MKSTRRTLLKGAGAGGVALASVRFSPLALGRDEPSPGAVDQVATTCWVGKQDCGILAHRVDRRVVKLEGIPESPRNLGTLCPKGVGQILSIYDPNRVRAPLARTNEKGVPGRWRQISWDEALEQVAARMKEIRKKDPELLLWQKGRSKSEVFYDKAFVEATGAQVMGHEAYSADAASRASEYTLGLHGALHPDFRYTRQLLSWGWNITNAGGNKLCWIVWNRQMLEARDRGLRIVHIDPRLRAAGPFSDEWLPIRPGTDLALALALCNGLIKQGDIDRPYLRKFTNAPYLVKSDGIFLRINGREQVWDTSSNAAKPAGQGKPALEGTYTVNGQTVKPAFQLLKEHVARYTPEWAAKTCGLDPEQIRRLAGDLGTNASIGATIEVDGVRLPLRPVAAMAQHMAQQENGFQAVRAMITVFMLLGAVGAVGGLRSDFKWDIDDNYRRLDRIEIGDPPYDVQLKDSKYYPINSGNPSVAAQAMLDPKKYEVDEKKIPEMVIVHMANPIVSFPNTKVIAEAYKKFKFVAVISPWLSETADHYADIVLPAATIEKYEGPLNATDQYTDAVALRVPPMKPLFQSRGEIDIYLDLCEKAGILRGKGGYLDHVNRAMGLEKRYALPLDRKPEVRDIFDRWAKSQGIKQGVSFFEKKGANVEGPVDAREYYGLATDPPFGGAVHRLYGESLLRYRNEMKAKGAGKAYWQDYTALPTWREPTMDDSPGKYDLYLISYKYIEYKQSRSSFFPLLAELQRGQAVAINPRTARAKGIGNGDEVFVEAHNAVTGRTDRLKARAEYFESMRPDTVGMAHHYGLWTHPWAKGQGPTPNQLFQTGEGYVANTADQSFHVKVRVSKA